MRKLILLLSLMLVIGTSCKKEGEVCYECKDAQGVYLQEVCGEDEQDAFNKSGIIGGVHDINVFRQYCLKK